MHHSTKGGSSDTDVKLLTVIPIWDVSAEPAVITAIREIESVSDITEFRRLWQMSNRDDGL